MRRNSGKNLVDALVWRKSIYQNGFKCHCGTLLFDIDSHCLTQAVIDGEKQEGKLYLYCANCGYSVGYVTRREEGSEEMSMNFQKQQALDAEEKAKQAEHSLKHYKRLLSEEKEMTGKLKAESVEKNATIHALKAQITRIESEHADEREVFLKRIKILEKIIHKMQDSFLEETGHRWEET